MNIVDQFGKRKNGLVLDPAPMPPIARPAKPAIHPDAVKHIDDFNRMCERVAVLEAENVTLQKNLEVALGLGNEFKRLHDLAVADARHWEAYAVEARTYAQLIRDAADRLHQHGK